MNTPGADTLIQSESMAQLKRQASKATLEQVLRSIPKVAPVAVDAAVVDLMAAADQYRAARFLVDEKGRRSKPGIAEARRAVALLHKALSEAQKHLANLPLNAFTELTAAYDAPMGRLKADVEQVCEATEAALKSLRAKPDKTPDHARTVLAYQVAVVFRDILKKKPSSASEKSLNVTQKRGGAAYARVLRATLNLSGITDYDPGPLITAGLRLLNDPNLP